MKIIWPTKLTNAKPGLVQFWERMQTAPLLWMKKEIRKEYFLTETPEGVAETKVRKRQVWQCYFLSLPLTNRWSKRQILVFAVLLPLLVFVLGSYIRVDTMNQVQGSPVVDGLVPQEITPIGITAVAATDESAGVGEVFVFKKSSFDATAIMCRHQKMDTDSGSKSYRWAKETTRLNRNYLWVQWITFENETIPIYLQIRLFEEYTEDEEVNNQTEEVVKTRNPWEANQSALMARGHMFFELPDSEKMRILEIQRFRFWGNEIEWDTMVFYLEHKTDVWVEPVTFLWSQVFQLMLGTFGITIFSGGLGGYWRGRHFLKKAIYVPPRYKFVGQGSPTIGVLAFFQAERATNLLLENWLFYGAFWLIVWFFTFWMASYMTTQMHQQKPNLTGVQVLNVNVKMLDLYMPLYLGYTYAFVDKRGNLKTGWIPQKDLNSWGEYKGRCAGKHRELRCVKEVEPDEPDYPGQVHFEPSPWGLIARDDQLGLDPGKYLARSVHAPGVEEQIIQRKVPQMAWKKKWFLPVGREEIGLKIEEETICIEHFHMLVIPAPKGMVQVYKALEDVERALSLELLVADLRDEVEYLHRNTEQLVDQRVADEVAIIQDNWRGDFLKKQAEDFKVQLEETIDAKFPTIDPDRVKYLREIRKKQDAKFAKKYNIIPVDPRKAATSEQPDDSSEEEDYAEEGYTEESPPGEEEVPAP
jgi:hypothetical protein